jgi:putative endonuclease
VHFVYIVRCADGTLYTGYARDPDARAEQHNAGKGAKYTAARRPVTLVYQRRCRSRSTALQREYQLKQLSRSEKEAIIASPTPAPRRPPARR